VSEVYIARCRTYEYQQVLKAVREAIDGLGGICRFIREGQRVLLKPNLLRASVPSEAIITHPTVVRAVVELVQEAGAQAVIADSPGPPYSEARMRGFYVKAGLMAVAEETGAELVCSWQPVQLSNPSGKLMKMIDAMDLVTQVDAVINLPKLKTHGLTRFTGATKNLFGLVPGLVKMGYHAKLQTAEQFSEMLIDLLQFHSPVLTVMDAVVGMEGDGPSAGNPRGIGCIDRLHIGWGRWDRFGCGGNFHGGDRACECASTASCHRAWPDHGRGEGHRGAGCAVGRSASPRFSAPWSGNIRLSHGACVS